MLVVMPCSGLSEAGVLQDATLCLMYYLCWPYRGQMLWHASWDRVKLSARSKTVTVRYLIELELSAYRSRIQYA